MAKKAKYYQEGAAVAPLATPTGIPAGGHAAQPIADYLAGPSLTAPLGTAGTSYTPGLVESRQRQRIADVRGLRELTDLGVSEDAARQLIQTGRYQDSRDDGSDALTPQELQRLQETGSNGHIISRSGRGPGGWREWGVDTPTIHGRQLTADERLSADFSHLGEGALGQIPGVGTAIGGALGGWNRAAQRDLREAGGVTYNIGGQPVTVGPDGSVAGTLPPGVSRNDVVSWARGQGQEITTPEFELPSFFSGLGEVFGLSEAQEAQTAEQRRQAAEAAAREEAAARARAAELARQARQSRPAGSNPNAIGWTDNDNNPSTPPIFDNRTPAQAERESNQSAAQIRAQSRAQDPRQEHQYSGGNYGGGRQGSGTGGQARSGEFVSSSHDWSAARAEGGYIYKRHGGEVEEDIKIAQSRIKDGPLAQAGPQVATPAGMPQRGPGVVSQVGQHVAGKMLEKALAGTLLGGTGGILAGGLFNKGGMVEYKEMGGMVGGPLGMKDMQSIGRSEDVSKVKMKSAGKDQSHEVEVSYHAPLSYQQPKGE